MRPVKFPPVVGTSFTTIGVQQPANLTVVVIDNERYGETGSQISHTGLATDLAAVALSRIAVTPIHFDLTEVRVDRCVQCETRRQQILDVGAGAHLTITAAVIRIAGLRILEPSARCEVGQ